MADLSQALQEAVATAAAEANPVYIRGGGSKTHRVGRHCGARPLDVGQHCGVIDYQPGELLLHARAGTPISELTALLANEDQVLPFEPPLLAGRATLGGTLACNLSGPGRPWTGSVRDATMGLGLINGCGDQLALGGRVMKNVAGYDASRLQAGALGCLGLITDVAVKVLPRPELSTTLCLDMDAPQALTTMARRSGEPKPLSGACWTDGRLYLRLSGAASAVRATAAAWGGETLADGDTFWARLREMTLPFFAGPEPLWRLSCGVRTPLPSDTDVLLDWGGQQRWQRGPAPVDQGTATLFAGDDRCAEVNGTPDPISRQLQQRLKQVFDPRGIFNPGRLYSWM